MQHLLHTTALPRSSHPAGTARPSAPALRVVASSTAATTEVAGDPDPVTASARGLMDEDGSLVTEYGLLAVVAATIAGVVMTWASGGALVTLFNALLRQARSLVGA
jgi:Flp pilus assembly pilin Flp